MKAIQDADRGGYDALRLIEDRPFGKVTLTVGASGDLAGAGAGHRGDLAG